MDNENWFYSYWRPAMGWSYLLICVFDFVLAPVLISLYCWYAHVPLIVWDPITLKGGAIYHASMGAICGVTSWSRGKEKIASIQSGTDSSPPDDSANAAPQAIISQLSDQITVRRQGSDE